MQKTKLHELLEFPCDFPYKVMGLAQPDLQDKVLAVVQKHIPGDYSPTIKPSSKAIITRFLLPSEQRISNRSKVCIKNWQKLILSKWCCNSPTVIHLR